MSKNGSWIYKGKDGEYYESLDEQIAADNRWDQQQAQNELLARQNELLVKQSRDKERLAREEMANARAIEDSRQEHDKEMRLLALCDEIGISKKTMDNYLDYILSTTDGLKNDELKEYEKLNEEYDKIDEQIKELTDEDEEEEGIPEIEVWKGLGNLDKRFLDYIDDEEILQLFDDSAQSLKGGLILFVVGLLCLFFFIGMIGDDSGTNLVLILVGSIPLCVSIYLLLRISSIDNKIKVLCNEKVIELSNVEDEEEEEEAEEDEISKLEKKQNEISDKLHLIYEKNINRKLAQFYKFRQGHYNPQLEKFLLDFDFEEKLHRYGSYMNIDYQVVTKSKATNTGEIDDYVEFFNDATID